MTKGNKRFFLIPALVSVLFFTAVLLCACAEVRIASGLDKNNLLAVNDAACTKKEAVFMLMEEKMLYDELREDDIWSRPIGSYTMSEYVKEVVKERLIKYTTAVAMSDAMAVYPSDDEKKLYDEMASKSWADVSAKFDVASYDLTEDDAKKIYSKEAVYEAVLNKISENASSGITEESCRVIQADYAVIPRAVGYDRADELRTQVKEGADFEEVISNAGHVFNKAESIKRGDVNDEFDTVAFALHDGEMSEVVESRENYYIIRCIDDELVDESMAYYTEQMKGAREGAFESEYIKFAEKARLSFDKSYWKGIKIGELK